MNPFRQHQWREKPLYPAEDRLQAKWRLSFLGVWGLHIFSGAHVKCWDPRKCGGMLHIVESILITINRH